MTRRVDSVSSNAYYYFIQPFKEMTLALDDHSNGTHLEEVKIMMEELTQKAIARAAQIYKKCEPPLRTVLPFCVPKDKKRRVNHSSR